MPGMMLEPVALLGLLLLLARGRAVVTPACASDECPSTPQAAVEEGPEETGFVQHMIRTHASTEVAFVNATIYTSNSLMPTASTVVINGKTIVYVGDEAGAEAKGLLKGAVHRLNGQVLLPGFVESHVHMLHGTLMQSGVIIESSDSIPEVLKKVSDYAKAHPASEKATIFGSAYMGTHFPGTFGTTPNKTLLDNIVSDRPVLLNDHTGHSCWGNSKFFEMAGITPETFATWSSIKGGSITHNEQHEPTGFLAGGPAWLPYLLKMNMFSKDSFTQGLPTTLNALSRHGFTAAFDAGSMILQSESYAALKGLDDEGSLPLHGRVGMYANTGTNVATALDNLTALAKKYNSQHVKFVGYKISLDSVMENQEAAVLEPYLNKGPDAKMPRGSLYFNASSMDTLVQGSAAAGYEINIHCIGDWCTREALNAAERLRQTGDNKTLFTIHHSQMSQPVDRPRYAQLNVKVQTTGNWAGGVQKAYPGWIGQNRTDTLMFPFAFWEENGIDVALGADWPATPGGMKYGVNPFWNLYTAATRTAPPGTWGQRNFTGNKILGSGEGPMPPQQETMSLAKGFEAYTMGGARMLNMQDQVGSIEEGKSADLILVDRDIFQVPLVEMPRTQVLVTVFEGKIVSCKDCKSEDSATDKEDKGVLLLRGTALPAVALSAEPTDFDGFHAGAFGDDDLLNTIGAV